MKHSFAFATLAGAMLLGSAAYAADLPSAAAVGPNASAQDVRQALQAVGFSQVSKIDRSGDIIRVDAAYRGAPVKLTVDARNGRIIDETARSVIDITPNTSDAQVRAELAGLGYTDVGPITHRGSIYVAQARKAGDLARLRVDSKTGRVTNDLTPYVQHIALRPNMDDRYVAAQLQQLGYVQVGDVARAGDVYRVSATKDGVASTLRIDGRTGAVTR